MSSSQLSGFKLKIGQYETFVSYNDEEECEVVETVDKSFHVYSQRSGNQRTFWIVIPVKGGFIVVKITLIVPMSEYQVSVRAIEGDKPKALSTIQNYFNQPTKIKKLGTSEELPLSKSFIKTLVDLPFEVTPDLTKKDTSVVTRFHG